MLSDRDHVGTGNLGDGDLALVGRVEVDVVRPDTGGNTKLELLGLGDEVGGEVAGVEGGGDEDLCVGELLLEDRVLPLLVVGDDKPGISHEQRGGRSQSTHS